MTRLFITFLMILAFASQAFPQTAEEGMRKAALQHMNNGKYGEAIDLLNKYVSANPRKPEGYHLRGLCFEKREQYQSAVIDLRRAKKLAPGNNQIGGDLNRVITIWHKILHINITGYLREIAIDPNYAFNYLEIGKSYRWLEEWLTAEEWYDKYLERDDNASPDEIIRYSEILAKNNHIKKGEIILKKYVERYPEDWRLWSRYGYFTLWLGKNRVAIQAFENALSFKPFFKEAQDGLDLAKRDAYVTQYQPDEVYDREFPIDRYYRILRKDPENDEIRFKLIDDLIKANRVEEAYQQLQILGIKFAGDPRYEEKWEYVTTYRQRVYSEKITEFSDKLEKDPNNKNAVKNLATYYEYMQNYDEEYAVLNRYFSANPDEKDEKLKFQYARAAAWSRDFDGAIQIMDELLSDKSENLDYQLFRAQLSVWTQQDLELAKEYLTNVLESRPENLNGLIAMSSLLILENDMENAQLYADKAKDVDPANEEVIKLQSNIDFHKMRLEEERLYDILNEGRQIAMDGDCEGALQFYEDYIRQAEPNNLILKEYGDILFCAEHYDEALSTYDEVLSDGYYYEASLQRAKVLYAMHDSLEAVSAFQDVVAEEPYEFEPRLYLGDAYAQAEMFDSAAVTYDSLLTWDLDSTETAMVELRQGWLPKSGFGSFIETFPNYVGLAPLASFYADNLSFRIYRYGGRIELGITNFLTLAASLTQSKVVATQASLDQDIINDNSILFTGNRDVTTFKGHAFLRLGKLFSAGAGLGTNNISGLYQNKEYDFFARLEERDHFFVNAYYINTDAVLALYSPYLIDVRLTAWIFKLSGYFRFESGLNFGGFYQYLAVPGDYDNRGNDMQIRIGKFFFDDINAGYEYYYDNWRFDSQLYYSPIGFNSHSLWADYYLFDTEELRVILGGKAGYTPTGSVFPLAATAEALFRPNNDLMISGKFGAGSTVRDDASYNFLSGELAIYWNVW